MLGPTRTQFFIPNRHAGAILRAVESLKGSVLFTNSPTNQQLLRKIESSIEGRRGSMRGGARLDHLAADTLGYDRGHGIDADGVWVLEEEAVAMAGILGEAKKTEYHSGVYNDYHNAERYLTKTKGA